MSVEFMAKNSRRSSSHDESFRTMALQTKWKNMNGTKDLGRWLCAVEFPWRKVCDNVRKANLTQLICGKSLLGPIRQVERSKYRVNSRRASDSELIYAD